MSTDSAQPQAEKAYTDVRPMPGFERIYLYCPSGHEVVSAPVGSPTGRALVAGDFSVERCGMSSCDWKGSSNA